MTNIEKVRERIQDIIQLRKKIIVLKDGPFTNREKTDMKIEVNILDKILSYIDSLEEESTIDKVEVNTMLSNLDIYNMSINHATSSLDGKTILVNMAIEKCQHALQNIILSQKYTTYEVDRESAAGNIIVRGYLYVKKKEE